MKIDSIQNVLLLRSDLHDAWDSYKFGVNPDVCYVFRAFVTYVFTASYNSVVMSLPPSLRAMTTLQVRS